MSADILSRIVAHKRLEIEAAKRLLPPGRLRRAAEETGPGRPFTERLRTAGPGGANIIAEIKRASPSKGVLCESLDPERCARAYELGGAAALSVLTDEAFFRGSADDLRRARAVTDLPVLRKDFIIDAYQVYEAKTWQADAVLLIVRILERPLLQDLLALCREIRLDALVEIHTARDLETAQECGAELIGINNRNLATFHTDIETAITLKERLGPRQIAVAASGISSRRDILRNLELGIYNFLIGESLVTADDTVGFLRHLLGNTGTS